jgi:hypothetical protein
MKLFGWAFLATPSKPYPPNYRLKGLLLAWKRNLNAAG